MEKSNVIGFTGREETADALTELLRQGAREWIQQAVEAELAEFMTSFANRRLHDGRSAVVRNGYLPERSIQMGIGPVTVGRKCLQTFLQYILARKFRCIGGILDAHDNAGFRKHTRLHPCAECVRPFPKIKPGAK